MGDTMSNYSDEDADRYFRHLSKVEGERRRLHQSPQFQDALAARVHDLLALHGPMGLGELCSALRATWGFFTATGSPPDNFWIKSTILVPAFGLAIDRYDYIVTATRPAATTPTVDPRAMELSGLMRRLAAAARTVFPDEVRSGGLLEALETIAAAATLLPSTLYDAASQTPEPKRSV